MIWIFYDLRGSKVAYKGNNPDPRNMSLIIQLIIVK